MAISESETGKNQEALDQLIEHIQQIKHYPVDKWQPARVGEVDICIQRDGTWLYRNSPIARLSLVKLFSSVLLFENQEHYLITPAEKLRIEVEDAPFLATELTVFHASTEKQVLACTTNVGDQVIVNADNKLWVEHNEDNEPSPYVHVRRGLRALLTRSVWIELADYLEEHAQNYVVRSSGMMFALEPC